MRAEYSHAAFNCKRNHPHQLLNQRSQKPTAAWAVFRQGHGLTSASLPFRRTIMDLTGLLNDTLSGDTVSQISQTIGADESSTSNAIQAALPMLLGGLAQQTSTEEGAS